MIKKCLIIDDEPLAINVIQKFLTNFNSYEVVGTFGSAIEALEVLSNEKIDVIFLDINMPILSGMDFVKSMDKMPLIIITTAYREYAVESYELNILDYLVKPIAFQRFVQAINKIEDRLADTHQVPTEHAQKNENTPHEDFLFFKVDKKMIKVFYDEIVYVESLKDYVRIKTDTENLVTHNNLVGISQLLPESDFMRIHRSYIVSIKRVKAVVGNTIEIGDKSFPIGRNYQQSVKSYLLKQDRPGD